MAKNNLSPLAIAGYATIDIKKDEKAILEISKENDIFVKSKDYEVIKNLIKDIELGKKND